jgi:lysophospholipase L1-like esterase
VQAPASAAPGKAKTPVGAPAGYYLALGDSVAAGVGAPLGGGYPELLAGLLSRDRCGAGAAVGCRFALDNISVSGATTLTLIAAQLPEAVAVLQARNGNRNPADDVRLITLTIGGNDLFRPIIDACGGGPTIECTTVIATQFAQVQTSYQQILGALRAAAGPGTTIAVMTYYNALVGDCELPDELIPFADIVLEGGGPLPAGVNDIIRAVSGAFGAVTVDSGDVVGAGELVGDCLHPNAAGHAAIAGAFADAVAGAVVGGPVRR